MSLAATAGAIVAGGLPAVGQERAVAAAMRLADRPAHSRGRWVLPTATPTPTPAAPDGDRGNATGISSITGDCNDDGTVTVDELVRGVNIVLERQPLSRCPAFDFDGDGRVAINELVRAVNILLNGAPPTPTRTQSATVPPTTARFVSSSPANGEGGVALTRETVLRFSAPIDPDTVTRSTIHGDFGGGELLSRLHISPDRKTVTIFYDVFLPPSARVRVTIDGNAVRSGGVPVDADGDGQPGGIGTVDFDTLSLATIPGTAVCGRVFASQLVPGENGQSVNVPLEGVTIEVDGLVDMTAVTDQFGNFRLEPAPAGRFFVFIMGTTATNGVPPGAYYPNVGKAWVAQPGVETNIGEIFLPLIEGGTLQPVSATGDTVIRFPDSVLQDFPEFGDVRLTVPADSLFDNDGDRGGMVGIAPVSPDRLPSRLPPGLQFPLVITVQTDGAENFDQPVPVCFPNLPDPATGRPLPPGAESALWSFNHDTGEFEVVGPMRVTADGRLVCSEPGGGIVAPGWHGTQPGVGAGGGPILGEDGDTGGGCPICEPDPCPSCQNCCQACGDGLVCANCGEECDAGANNGGASCTADCKLPCNHPDSAGCAAPAPPDDDCGANVCNQSTGACQLQATNTGGACDVGNPCSFGGTCAADGTCDSQPNDAGTCDDGNECTTGDHCEDGQCTGNQVPAGTACCGNGEIDPGEECDSGSANSDTATNACRTNCSDPFCGDGVVDSMGVSGAEECDDGEAQNTGAPNACRPNCTSPFCGDNIVDTNFGEECDLANDNSQTPNSCRPDCKNPRCGDGLLDDDFGETCDDGPGNSNTVPDSCRTDCSLPRCGDGVVDSNNVCDDGNSIDGDGCSSDCLPECGNGVVDQGEQCDDDNTAPCDGCSATCRSEQCGNGIVECTEECDEGGSVGAGPGCRDGCMLPECGDGTVDPPFGEECDDGGTVSGDGCSATCQTEQCGNLALDPGESCDDGNTAGCDGCAADCARADRICGDGIRECGEVCDDGANNSDVLPNRCRASTCLPAGCGDGVLDTGEGCDDGNVTSNDGCSASCQTEIGTNPVCGDGIVQTGEQCDDGAANANAPNACRVTCELPRCGDGIEDDAPPTLEACDDGNTAGGDACPASCQFELELTPRLIVGLGLCGIQPRDIQVTELPGGQVITTDPNVEYEFVSADGLDRQVVDQVWTFLRNRQVQKGVPADQLLPEEPPIANIEVVNGQVTFASEGVNVLRARRGNATSNFAFVIGGGLELANAKSLKIKPFSLANIGINTAADAINDGFKQAEKDFSIDPPMFLFLGQLCLPVVDVTPGDFGIIGVEELKFDLFNGEIEDVDLMDGISGLIDLIPEKSPILWLAKAVLKVAAQIGVAQLLEFGIGDNGGQQVVSVSENFSLTDPPFLGGIVEAVAPGVAVVEGKFEMECVGEAEDDMLVFVAPELVGTDIRSEAGVVEDPLITPLAPAARRPHAVGFFNVLSGTHQLEIETPPLLPEEEIEFLEALLPGELEIGIGLTQPLTLPLGASIGLSGFYEEGDFFLSIDGVTATFAAGGGVTLALESVDLQTRLPNFATEWTVIDPTIAVLDNDPSPIETERELSCIQPGDTEVQVDACLIGASVNTVSDLNGVHCRAPTEPCGDGSLDPGETCDPPGEPILNPPTGKFCRGDCTFCGDGFVQLDQEGCDDGNDISGDGCEPNCLPTLCGDGVVQGPDETCDPPGAPRPPHGNACRLDCTFCGDGRVDAGEQCDDGATPGGCLPNCTLPTPTPTNTSTATSTPTATATPTGPTLTPTPTIPSQCGDGIVQPPEQCDDGNAVDGDACRNNCTLPVDIPLPLELCISEVVTDPQSDWSDSTGQAGQDFDAAPGPGPVTPGDPVNEYIEIRNTSNRFLTLAGVTLRMSDSTPAFHVFGLGSALEHYSLNSNAFLFRPGAVVVVGNPVGELDDNVFLELLSPSGPVITDVEIGGNFASTNFEADDDHDGLVNEDGPDGIDEDGDILVDEDGIVAPFKPDPVADGAPGVGLDGRATDAADEALHRVADTPTMLAAVGPLAFEFPLDSRNYQRGRGTPRLVALFTDRLTIDEVVTRPLRDWSDSTGAVGVAFDEFAGPGPVAAGNPRNEFVEIRNRGPVAVRVRDMVVHMNDATPETYRIGSPSGGTVERYTSPSSTPSSADALQPGGVLVIGDPPGEMDDQIFIALVVPCVGTVSDVEIGGNVVATNFESDSDRDGLVDEDPLDGADNDGDGFTDEDRSGPDPIGDGAPPQPASNIGEALRRIADDADDTVSFARGNANPGATTGPTP